MAPLAPGFLGLLGFLLLGIGIRGCTRSIRARHWVKVMGHVSTAGYDTVRRAGSGHLEYLPWIEYQYQFKGRTYRSGRCYPPHALPLLKDDAIRHAESRPAGSEIAVWVNPRQAVESTLVASVEWRQLVPVFFGAGMVALAAVLLLR